MTNTMREVARRAGVSISTVSYVVNGGPRPVSAAVRARVRQAMEELGYEAGGRGRPRQTEQLIGALVPDTTNSFFASVLAGAISVLRREGHILLTASSGEDSDRELREFRALRRARVQGLLLTPRGQVPPEIAEAATAGLPVVLMDRDGPSEGFARVVMANYRNSVRAVRVLADAGHRRIALVNGPRSIFTAEERRRGYVDGLRQAGLPFRSEFLRLGEFTREQGRRATTALLSLREPPEAIFSASAILTEGVLQALRQQGLRWPDDVAIIGYGDPPWASFVSPPLTVIDQPTGEIGATAARLLLDGGARQKRRLVLDSHVLVRESHWKKRAPRARATAGGQAAGG